MHRRLAKVVAVALVAASVMVAIWSSDTIGGGFDRALAWVLGIIERHSTMGKVLFVLLSALSAMAAFLSSALLVPVATAAWGRTSTLVLLLVGWIAGGVAAYGIGRFLGRSVVNRLIPGKLEKYERQISQHSRWWMMLLFQLGMPSEVPGYVAGMVRYRFVGYLAALTIAELPYAAGAVLLGESFAQRNAPLFLALVASCVLFVALTWRFLGPRLATR